MSFDDSDYTGQTVRTKLQGIKEIERTRSLLFFYFLFASEPDTVMVNGPFCVVIFQLVPSSGDVSKTVVQIYWFVQFDSLSVINNQSQQLKEEDKCCQIVSCSIQQLYSVPIISFESILI